MKIRICSSLLIGSSLFTACAIDPYQAMPQRQNRPYQEQPYPQNQGPLRAENPEAERRSLPPVVSRNQGRPARPKLQRLKNGHYRVMEPWRVALKGKVWNVQKGYTSNGITAPSYLKSSLGDGVSEPETWSAVFHDWLFTQPGVSRREADQAFRDIMLAYGVNSGKANLMYNVVSEYSRRKESR